MKSLVGLCVGLGAWLLLPGVAVLALQPDWPIKPITVPLDGLETRHAIDSITQADDCEPESFDPKTFKFLPNDEGRPGKQFRVPGDDACTIVIDGWSVSGDQKIVLRSPYTATRYYFHDPIEGTSAIEIRKNGVRHALYTHIDDFRLSDDSRILLLKNAFSANRQWYGAIRIIDVESKRAASLPIFSCTNHLATVQKGRAFTYDDAFHTCIWDLSGKLVAAYEFPEMPIASGGEIPNALGLLPAQPSTMFVLYEPEEHGCVVALQAIGKDAHRALRFQVPNQSRDEVHDWHLCSIGTGLMVDWADLTLTGGHMRYRISPSQRGDLLHDWGPWITLR